MNRYYAKRYNKAKDLWGIWDRANNAYLVSGDGRWTSSYVGAFICAGKMNEEK